MINFCKLNLSAILFLAWFSSFGFAEDCDVEIEFSHFEDGTAYFDITNNGTKRYSILYAYEYDYEDSDSKFSQQLKNGSTGWLNDSDSTTSSYVGQWSDDWNFLDARITEQTPMCDSSSE